MNGLSTSAATRRRPPKVADVEPLRVAARAVAATDPCVAVALLDRAEARCGDRSSRIDIIAQQLGPLVSAGRLAHAIRRARVALEDETRPEQRATLQIGLAQALLARGMPAAAAKELRPAVEELTATEPQGRRARALLALALLRSYNLEESAARAAEALADEGAPTTREATMAMAVLCRIAALRGDHVHAVRLGRAAVTSAAPGGAFDHVPHAHLGLALLNADQIEAGLHSQDQAIAASTDRGDDVTRVHLLHARALSRFFAGSWDAMRADVDEALECGLDYGLRAAVAQSHALCGLVALYCGDGTTARRHHETAQRELERRGADRAGTPYVGWLGALLASDDGDAQAAAQLIGRAGDLCHELAQGVQLWFAIDLVRLLLAADDRGEAANVSRRLGRIKESTAVGPTATVTAAAAIAGALVSGDVDAITAAARIYQAVPRPLDRLLAAEAAGDALATVGRDDEARTWYRTALVAARALQARYLEQRISAGIRATGAGLGSRGPRRRPLSGWAALSPAERAVLRWVAEGLTNAQVAERLFIARRTVATHLEHIYAKTGLTNRTMLVSEAIRRNRC